MSATVTSEAGWRNIRLEVMDRIERLPSLNNVVMEFLKTARSDTAGAAEFEAVIRKDQALVARLLKVANSGLFGRSRSITSIQQATVLVGLENLKRLVYAVSSEGFTLRELTHYDFHPDGGFWRHAMSVAVAAQTVAAAAPEGDVDPDEAFVAGLLHDTGKLVLDEFLTSDPDTPVYLTAETDLDHCELGELILRQWDLPESLCTAVRYSHDHAGAGAWQAQASVLCLARAVCHGWAIGRNPEPDLDLDIYFDLLTEPAAVLGIVPDAWDDLVDDIRRGVRAVSDLYGED